MFVHKIGRETPASPGFFLVSRLRIDVSQNTYKPRNSDGSPVRNLGGMCMIIPIEVRENSGSCPGKNGLSGEL